MPDSKSVPIYEVQLDIYIARRKRMHAIFDPSGIPVFHAPLIMQVLDWLQEQDVTTARFTDDETQYLVIFERRPIQDNQPQEAQNG